NPGIGIIMLTGRADTIDRIIGLEVGADDYLAKPFHLRELLARIRSVGRRVAPPANSSPHDARRVTFAGWLLDLATRELFSPERRAPGNSRGIRRSRCISPAGPHRGGAAPAALGGSPIPGRPRGTARTNCRSRNRC